MALKIKCFGISNSFSNSPNKIFFNEYDNFNLVEVLNEAKVLSYSYDIDVYVFESSPNHYHLVSFDILELEELKTIINNCTNDGDYLYNFFDKNYEYVLRLSDKDGKDLPKFINWFQATKNNHLASMQHLKAYRFFIGYFLPVPKCKSFENLETKLVVYQTNRRES